MDFITSTFSSLGIGASEYTKGSPIATENLIWNVYKGTVRKDGRNCTLFECTSVAHLKLASNFAKTLKKLRFPGLPKVYGEEITPKSVLVALEPLEPLSANLSEASATNRMFGLNSVLTTLRHLGDAKCVVANTHKDTIWINSTGDWVLAGFEVASFPGENNISLGSQLPQLAVPPEVAANGWIAANELTDTYQFGMLCKAILPSATQLIAQCTASKRPSLSQVSTHTLANPISTLVEQISQALMMNDYDFTQMMREAAQLSADLSPQLITGRLMPVLIGVYTNNQGRGGLELVRLVLSLCKRAQPSAELAQFIVHLFTSLDRAVRLELLQQMPNYIGVLDDRLVQQRVMPAMAVSFSDSEPLIRKQSLESVLVLAPKLSSRQLNGDLLRLLAKTNNDQDAEIRAQTVGVLAKLAQYMAQGTRSSVVVTALAKSLKDTSQQVRQASLEALASTSQYYTAKECAEKLLGPAASSLLDSKPEVRALGRSIVQEMLDKITTASEELDAGLETGLAPERIVPRDDTPSVAKLFRGAPSPAAAPAVPVVAEPTTIPPPPNRSGAPIVENAVYSDWNWDEEEPEPAAALPAAPHTAPLDPSLDPSLDPEDEAEDGWGDDW